MYINGEKRGIIWNATLILASVIRKKVPTHRQNVSAGNHPAKEIESVLVYEEGIMWLNLFHGCACGLKDDVLNLCGECCSVHTIGSQKAKKGDGSRLPCGESSNGLLPTSMLLMV